MSVVGIIDPLHPERDVEAAVVHNIREDIDQLAVLIENEDKTIAAQGWEILGCLDAAVRWQLAQHFIAPPKCAWRLATDCLMPGVLGQRRLARFAVRCAEHRLLQQRREGVEPPDWAWRAVEAADLRAQNRLPERSYQRILRETEHERDSWDDWHSEELGDGEVHLDQIPDGWQVRACEVGAQLDVDHLLKVSEWTRFATIIESEDRAARAERAAALSLVDAHKTHWGELIDNIPSPETAAEWLVQRLLWEAIVVRGEDGLDILYAPSH
jgi:hypothetical protein